MAGILIISTLIGKTFKPYPTLFRMQKAFGTDRYGLNQTEENLLL